MLGVCNKCLFYLHFILVDINVQNREGKTPLHIVAKFNSLNVVQILLDRGAAIDIKDINGCIPLHDAVRIGNISICQVLSIYY